MVGWAVAACLVVILATPVVGVETRDAPATIHQFYDALAEVMRNGPTLGEKGRYQRLEPVIAETFDLPAMTRAVTGFSWERLSLDQQQKMITAFSRYTTAVYADRFASSGGETFEITGQTPHGTATIVDSRIVKADGSPVPIRYLMQRAGDSWRVKDIYLAGTISELATTRAQFSSIIERQGIDGLIRELDHKTETMLSSTGH
ncbi:MAG TPA: ABC transporter substrate-binding protein [Stellaceae bacterium]|nr:ABC transporter substrate-binding protein [Stellaceae bacterium]